MLTIKRAVVAQFILAAIIWLGLALPHLALAEAVYVKYRGLVDLAPFECEWVSRSALVERLCYDPKEEYVVVSLRGTYYHYCEVPMTVVERWRQAESMGHFYNAYVKARFDCRVLRMPSYEK